MDGEHTCEELWELGYFTDYYNYCDFPEQMGPEPDEQLPITEEQLRESISDGWATSLQLPEDTRPAAPEWTPPFEVGASGWKDSSAPFCQPFEKPPDLSGLWVDERGAFVSVARHCGYALGKEVCDETQGGALYHNTGDGWVVIATPAERIPQMHAFSDGRFLFGTQTLFDLDAGATVILDPSFGLSGAHIVARDLSALLFASDFDLLAGPSLTLYQLVDDAWVEQPEVEGLWHSAAFGADDSIVLAGGDGLAIFDGSSTTPVGNVPAGNYKGGV